MLTKVQNTCEVAELTRELALPDGVVAVREPAVKDVVLGAELTDN